MKIPDITAKIKNKAHFKGFGNIKIKFPVQVCDISEPLCMFAAGFIIIFCLCMMITSCLEQQTAELKLKEAEHVSQIKPILKGVFSGKDHEAFISSDPFRTKKEASAEEKREQQTAALSLDGTLSPYAAYLNSGSGPDLVLKGQEYMGFRLVSVSGGEVKIEKDGNITELYMSLVSAGGKTPPPPAPKTERPSGVWNREPAKPVAGVEAASPGVTGSLPRELVDKLLMNPYEEMAKIRMIPSEQGMKIARIANDSILAAVGVEKNDIIKAVNGVTITNLGDATNAINSMMSGTRFDVTVEREGSPIELKYEVK